MTFFALKGSPFDAWRRAAFTDAVVNNAAKEAAVWGDCADPDNDRLTNLEEAFFGTNPMQHDAEPAASMLREPGTGYFIARWKRYPFDYGIQVRPQWSPDLLAWFSDGTAPDDESRALEFHHFGAAGGTGYDVMEARLHTEGLKRAYLRLQMWRE